MKYIVKSSVLSGNIRIPSSKSHTMRAILFASLAKGQSLIHHYLPSPDTDAMIQACIQLGAAIERTPELLRITGVAGAPHLPGNIIDVGNSGQVLRFIAAITSLTSGYTIFTGDESVRYNRPMQPLLNGIQQLGGMAVSTKNDGRAPVIIKGPIHSGTAEITGEDSQPVSALLMAAAFLPGKTRLTVNNPGEKPWVELTLDWLRRLGIDVQHKDYQHYEIAGSAAYDGFEYTVPGDFSSAAFPIIAAMLTQSEIKLDNIDMSDVQGDKAVIAALENMGAQFDYDKNKKQLHIKKSGLLKGGELNINDYIDALCVLSVAGCVMENALVISGAEAAQYKESNRLTAMTNELKKMGASINELVDGLMVVPSLLKGAEVKSYDDHRVAMSLVLAGLCASGETIIHDIECVNKSFPQFYQHMKALGADIQEIA